MAANPELESALTSFAEASQEFFDASWRPKATVIAVAAPSAIRKLLLRQDLDADELAIEAHKLQMETYTNNVQAIKNGGDDPTPQVGSVGSLFDTAAKKLGKLLEDDSENVDAVASLVNPSIARATWKWFTLPYPVFCSIQAKFISAEPERKRVHVEPDASGKEADVSTSVDHWILKNEEWLRNRRISDPAANWRVGLVGLDGMSNDVWSVSELGETYRKITRAPVDGFMFLDARKAAHIYIQPNAQRFKDSFERLTSGQLKGLDWSNIFVAGGSVLGSLLCVDGVEDPINTPKQWESSDIDVYIYGLDPEEANKKVHHLFDVFKANLPADAPVLVVRNTKTISFISNYPTRRFQIILKLCPSPAEILLNFDLDICAVGFDGTEVYMLPRAARALETGYNVWTMEMVQGHYLGTRRASQEQRVFKYADKGYGIRILPHYLAALKAVDATSIPKYYGINFEEGDPLNLQSHVNEARKYFDTVFRVYMKWTKNGETIKPHYVLGAWSGSRKYDQNSKSKQGQKRLPVLSHALLDTDEQITSEPLRRGCLTGFELLYRHVALWEAQEQGRLIIRPDVWASTTYEEVYFSNSYNDLPQYAWDETFSIKDFVDRVEKFNESQVSAACPSDLRWSNQKRYDELSEKIVVRRIICGSTLDEVFAKDIVISVWIPRKFVDYMSTVLKEVYKDHPTLAKSEIIRSVEDDIEVLCHITLDTIAMWQQIDRRVDELLELVWSFVFANQGPAGESRHKLKLLKRQISRRTARSRAEDELLSFASWVARDPGPIGGENYGAMGQGFWSECFPGSDAEQEEDGMDQDNEGDDDNEPEEDTAEDSEYVDSQGERD